MLGKTRVEPAIDFPTALSLASGRLHDPQHTPSTGLDLLNIIGTFIIKNIYRTGLLTRTSVLVLFMAIMTSGLTKELHT